MTELLCVPQGEFSLLRLPERRKDPLRAWDAADEYLLQYLAENRTLATKPNLLIINDSFGALAIALAEFQPQVLSDSYMSQQATRINLRANGLAETSVTLLNSLQIPAGPFDLVLIKVPKTLAFLEDLLLRLRFLLTPGTVIILAGMVKHLPRSLWPLLERIIGPTTSSLAKKKARLIFAPVDLTLRIADTPYPTRYCLENTGIQLVNHANVFSRAQLDIGARFFLQHIPVQPSVQTIVDLGCGNGVVGLMAALRNPQARLLFVDESFMAIASAQENFIVALGEQRLAHFEVADGLADAVPASVDLILCNPPFHQQQTVGDHLAMHLFHHAYQALRNQGELWIIGNRHLGYQTILHKLFGNSQLVAENGKFVVLKAIR